MMAGSFSSWLLTSAGGALNRIAPWHRQPRLLGIVGLVGIRNVLREQNLHDTDTLPSTPPRSVGRPTARQLKARTADGTFNDLSHPLMGSAGTRFGRNIPLNMVRIEKEPDLLAPNPRTISRELLTRDEFKPATTLNLLAAAWLQFMVHDWFSHGKNQKDNFIELPLDADDPWHEKVMRIRRSHMDPTRPPDANGSPPTFVNAETHWWDASQIYGCNEEMLARVRSGRDGKLAIGDDGLIPADPETGIEVTGVSGNWWVGLSLLHTLFTMEHNAVCDRLRAEYPSWSDDELFDHARLVIAALLAKIHTVEWTPGIVSHPTVKMGMRGNWWGLASERLYRRFGRISKSEVISGIPGSPPDHHAAPYAITEEFVSVYRMHPLMPDEFSFRSAADDRLIHNRTLHEVEGRRSRELLTQMSMLDALYSFGTSHPGAITLHNFPRTLQRFEKPDGMIVDLASIDVLRDRERGVPRYNEFRRLLHLPRVEKFEDLTDNPVWVEELRRVYDNDIDRVDLMIGMYAEKLPKGFGFSETAFRIFVLMASRRLKSDRFFTSDYTPEIYTQTGIDWINNNSMSTVLLRHFPGLGPALGKMDNAFAPWPRAT
ncbi:MAG: peroxidase family protein [Dehalococcoidia bacterium]